MTRELVVDNVTINDDSDGYVIAEIGHNHQGDLEKAKELFLAAKQCGVNAVKLQKRDNRTLFTREIYNSLYDNRNSFGRTYGEHREVLEFGRDEYVELKGYAAELGITFFASVFDVPSANFLMHLDMPAFKIASGDLKNTPLLEHVARFQKPIFLSTGGGAMEDAQRAYDAIMPINSQLCIMQCTSGYPAEFDELNLKVIETFRERFPDTVIGLSSHDNGIAMALIGYVLGARVIEKHFTLNRAMKGTDHAFSLEHSGLRRLARDLRRARVAIGDGVKRPYPSEDKPLYKMAKKLVAARDIPASHVLGPDDVAIKSPGDGLPPYEFDNVLGKMTLLALKEDDNIEMGALQEVEEVKTA